MWTHKTTPAVHWFCGSGPLVLWLAPIGFQSHIALVLCCVTLGPWGSGRRSICLNSFPPRFSPLSPLWGLPRHLRVGRFHERYAGGVSVIILGQSFSLRKFLWPFAPCQMLFDRLVVRSCCTSVFGNGPGERSRAPFGPGSIGPGPGELCALLSGAFPLERFLSAQFQWWSLRDRLLVAGHSGGGAISWPFVQSSCRRECGGGGAPQIAPSSSMACKNV